MAHEKGLRAVTEGELQGGVAGGWGQLVSCQRTLGKAVWQGDVLQTVISGLDKVLESFQRAVGTCTVVPGGAKFCNIK